MKVSVSMSLLLFHVILSIATASSSPSVIIVGAGMSGISAAKTLQEAGIKDFLILEATNRIGGRIWKGEFANHTIELGANWLFKGGLKYNIVHDIANKINLKSFYSDYSNLSSNTYKQEGGLYAKNEVEAQIEIADARSDFCSNLSRILSADPTNKENDISILAAERLYKKVPRTPVEMVVDFFYNDFEDAEPPRITSLKNTFPSHEFEDFGEDEYFVADQRGFESVVHYIAKQFLDYKDGLLRDPRVKLNKVVREISYSKSGATLKTEDGSVYNAKHVIVSVSIGVLQSSLIKFIPEFPQWKALAIESFDMAIYTKIFMKFPYKFWPTGNGTEFFLYAHEVRGYYPIWQHLENEIPGSNILFVTVTDTESLRIEQQSDEDTVTEAMEVLKKMFGKSTPKPISILVPRWWSNRFYKGTYSNWPAAYTQKRYQQLKAHVGPIYFTGEHTNSTYIGYVNGAYFSGINTANDLIKCHRNSSCKGHLNMHH
ncbi:Amino_oxidase domain-containing protein [Cephalotus follicularis]|uniref:Amino_oxidase domain-containing protein n=1 Tax=Cephalotus follicularis TaxID=3775 RepID=A0A1Q3C4V6_CEPFO|nr:Amino_oxidase domain-containing protein [Cephalotus follicularis]